MRRIPSKPNSRDHSEKMSSNVDLSPKLWKLKNDLLMAGGTLPKED